MQALISTAKHAQETRERSGFYRQAARGKHGAQMGVREARLRAEWASLYPGLASGEWMAASELVPLVLRHRLQDRAQRRRRDARAQYEREPQECDLDHE